MRLYTLELINERVDGTTTVESDQSLNEELGRADEHAFQVRVTNSAGTSPTITIELQHSNDNRHWVTHSTLLNAQDISSTPYEAFVYPGSSNTGGFKKVRVTLGGTNPTAVVKVTDCGRSS